MSRGAGFGLDAELAKKREEAFTSADGQQRANEAIEWVELLLGEKLEDKSDLHTSLKSGVVLCKLVNVVVPGTIPEKRINNSTMPFKQMENISTFLKAMRTIGVPEPDLFETVDLFDGKDLALVIQCLHSLGSTLQSRHPNFQGPHLGVARATANKRNFTQDQLRKGDMVGTSLTLGNSNLAHQAANDKLNGRVNIPNSPPTPQLNTMSLSPSSVPDATSQLPAAEVEVATQVPSPQVDAPPVPPKAKASWVPPKKVEQVAARVENQPEGRGCYLVAEEVSQGTLSMIWSECMPQGDTMTILAYFSPGKTVPKFKFTTNGGKSELVRGMRGPMIKNYYRGWLDFVKACRDYLGEFNMLPTARDISIHLNSNDLTVKKLEIGEKVSFNNNISGVVATSADSMTFQVSTMQTSLFLNKGNAEGSSVSL